MAAAVLDAAVSSVLPLWNRVYSPSFNLHEVFVQSFECRLTWPRYQVLETAEALLQKGETLVPWKSTFHRGSLG